MFAKKLTLGLSLVVLVFIVTNIFPAVAFTDQDNSTLQNSLPFALPALPEARVKFRQDRHIKSLSRALVSSGYLELGSDNSLMWVQEEPFSSTLGMFPDRIEETVAGQPTQITKAKDNPFLFRMAEAFIGLFSGNLQDLSMLFNVEVKEGEGNSNWQLVLTPKDVNVANALRRIDIRGGVGIESIRIEETSDNWTEILLTYDQDVG